MNSPSRELHFEYVNWRGERSTRRILPIEIWFGITDWHPNAQWFLKGQDLDKHEVRDFALRDINFNN
jgi:predicted DNA-binding transcriptional regulator YafY